MNYCRAVVHDDDDAFVLQIELMNDRSVVLTYPKPGGDYGDAGPYVSLWTGNGNDTFHDFGNVSLEWFANWAKIAIGSSESKQKTSK